MIAPSAKNHAPDDETASPPTTLKNEEDPMANQHRCLLEKTILLASLLGLTTVPALGQGISVGFRGGLNSATIRASEDVDLRSRTTFHLGGIVSIGIQETFALQIEAVLSEKGFAFGERVTFEVSYFQIPILAKVIVPTPPTSPVTPHFFAGPNLGFQVSCNVTVESDGVSTSGGCHDGRGTDTTKGFDFGLLFGGGISIRKGPVAFLVDVAFDFGVFNINDTSGSSATMRNRTFMASVGLMVPIR